MFLYFHQDAFNSLLRFHQGAFFIYRKRKTFMIDLQSLQLCKKKREEKTLVTLSKIHARRKQKKVLHFTMSVVFCTTLPCNQTYFVCLGSSNRFHLKNKFFKCNYNDTRLIKQIGILFQTQNRNPNRILEQIKIEINFQKFRIGLKS